MGRPRHGSPPRRRRGYAGALSEAARRQERFWTAHDALFLSPPGTDDESVEFWAEGKGFDGDALTESMASEEVLNRITEDVEQANTLNVRGTPTLFINGRRVKSHSKLRQDILLEQFHIWQTERATE